MRVKAIGDLRTRERITFAPRSWGLRSLSLANDQFPLPSRQVAIVYADPPFRSDAVSLQSLRRTAASIGTLRHAERDRVDALEAATLSPAVFPFRIQSRRSLGRACLRQGFAILAHYG